MKIYYYNSKSQEQKEIKEDLDKTIKRISKKYKPERETKLGASYLLPSGEFIYTKDYGHKEIDDYLVEIGEYKEEEIETEEGNFVLSKGNCVRLNAGIGFCFIGLPDRNLSLEQYESLEKWLELLEEKGYGRIDIFEQLKRDPQAKRYNLKEETPEEIIKKIKRYYSSGKLYESKIEEKIEITNYNTSFGDKEKEFKGYGNFAYIDRDGNYINGRLDEELEEMSNEYDSEGNQLTKAQAEFFKDSKVRDSKGRLLVCYHGTNNEFDEFKKEKTLQNFSVFGNGFYFLDNEEGTKAYGDKAKKCYLNMTNPLSWKKEKFGDYINKYHKEYFDNRKLIDIASEIEKEGFDGLIWKSDTYIVFEPNQIKSVTNKTPTNSNNINEELIKKWTAEEIVDIIDRMTDDGYLINWGDIKGNIILLAPNGEIIGVDNYKTHTNFCDKLEEYMVDNIEDFKSFHTLPLDYLEGIGFLTLNSGRVKDNRQKIVTREKPTKEQYKVIEEWLENAKGKVYVYCRNQNSEYDLDLFTPQDIIKAINKYYATGILTNKLEEKIKIKKR